MMAMRQVGAENEQLRQSEERGNRPKYDYVGQTCPQKQIETGRKRNPQQLAVGVITAEETQEPDEWVARRVRIKIGIDRGAGCSMMLVMIREQSVVRKARVGCETKFSNGSVHAVPTRRERAVNAVVRNYEKPRAEPGLYEHQRQDDDRGGPKVHEENSANVYREPRDDY